MTKENDTILNDLCDRIERMCRYSQLRDDEVNDKSMQDRKVVEGLYLYHKKFGRPQWEVERLARRDAIKLILVEAFS